MMRRKTSLPLARLRLLASSVMTSGETSPGCCWASCSAMLSGLPISSVPCFRRAGDHEEARPSALRQRRELVAKFLYFRFPAKKKRAFSGWKLKSPRKGRNSTGRVSGSAATGRE